MVLFKGDVRLFGEAIGIGLQGMQKTLDFSADLLVPGQAPVCGSNLSYLSCWRLHLHNTPPCVSAHPLASRLVAAGDWRGSS